VGGDSPLKWYAKKDATFSRVACFKNEKPARDLLAAGVAEKGRLELPRRLPDLRP